MQQNTINLINTSEGRYVLGTLGQKVENRVVKVTENSFIEYLGGRKFRATFFSKQPILDIVLPVLIRQEIIKYPRFCLNTSTFNPASGANSPVDGVTVRSGVSEDRGTIRSGVGTSADPTASSDIMVRLTATATTDLFSDMRRSIFLFDTSSLSGATNVSATLSIYGTVALDQLGSQSVALVSSNPASNNNLVSGDFNISVYGGTHFATDITYASWNTAGYNDFALNASGLANINLTGISKFGLRSVADVDNSAVTWSSGSDSRIHGNFADTGSNLPKLVVTYTPAPARGDFNFI